MADFLIYLIELDSPRFSTTAIIQRLYPSTGIVGIPAKIKEDNFDDLVNSIITLIASNHPDQLFFQTSGNGDILKEKVIYKLKNVFNIQVAKNGMCIPIIERIECDTSWSTR